MSSQDNNTEIYWPRGWSRDRFVHADMQEILTLDDSDYERMYASLKSTLGPEGYQQLCDEQNTNYQARIHANEERERAAGTAPPVLPLRSRVPALGTLEDLGLTDNQEWGWVAFRTGSSDLSGDAETRFRRRFDDEIARVFVAFDDRDDSTEAVRQLRARFSITWVTGADLQTAGPAHVAARYRAMRAAGEVPPGKDHNCCLLVDESCVRSVMEAPIPGPRTIDQQRVLPFVIAVSHYLGHPDNVEYEGERSSYRVAVRALPDSYFNLIASGARDVAITGAGVGENQVWWTVGGYGIFTPS